MIVQVTNPLIEVHDLTVSYDKKPVLWNVDLTVPAGSLVGIIGPNGAGKSTLLKAMMGLVPNSSGYIKLFEQPLEKVRQKISYVPQRESVDWDFPASALDVVLMGRYGKLGLFKKLRKSDREVAWECLKKVNMEKYAQRQISQLSGGQQQRIFLARALAQDAQLYCLDEPFAGVDIATETAIIEILQEMRKQGKTVLVVHHDLQSAADYFNWIVLLNVRLVASGPTNEVLTQELLQETYGGKLTVLSKVGDLLQKHQFPNRESIPTKP
jgi:manganese/zinc/iron transport system ATP- binding protein